MVFSGLLACGCEGLQSLGEIDSSQTRAGDDALILFYGTWYMTNINLWLRLLPSSSHPCRVSLQNCSMSILPSLSSIFHTSRLLYAMLHYYKKLQNTQTREISNPGGGESLLYYPKISTIFLGTFPSFCFARKSVICFVKELSSSTSARSDDRKSNASSCLPDSTTSFRPTDE